MGEAEKGNDMQQSQVEDLSWARIVASAYVVHLFNPVSYTVPQCKFILTSVSCQCSLHRVRMGTKDARITHLTVFI